MPIAMMGLAQGNPVVEGACGAVVEDDDEEKMADLLEEWARERDRAREIGARGRDFVRSKRSTGYLASVLDGILSDSQTCPK